MQQITLKAARVNAGYGQNQAAKILNITPKTLSFWENGKSFPTVDKVKEICDLYHVCYDDIIFLPSTSLKAKNEGDQEGQDAQDSDPG